MKKLVILLVISACIVSCTNKQSQKAASVNDSVPPVNNSLYNEETDEEYEEWHKAYFNNYSYEGIKLFEPMVYNDSDYSQQLFNIMDTIVGLFVKDDKYYMRECRIVKTNVFESECAGRAMIEPTLDTNERCLYLFRGLKRFNNKESVESAYISDKKIKTAEIKDFTFTFNDASYQLNTISSDNNEDHKLYLTSKDKSQCIIEIKKITEFLIVIHFIGDLDNDGKPDFIIQSPENHEDYRLLLFLSSKAENNEIVKLVSILVDSFPC